MGALILDRIDFIGKLAELEQTATIAGVDIFASWMFDVEDAYAKNDLRKVSSLIFETTTEIAIQYAVSPLALEAITPSYPSWDEGNRQIVCLIVTVEGDALTKVASAY